MRFFDVVVGGKILFSLETALDFSCGEVRGLGTRSLRSSYETMTTKRLTDGSGSRNGFGFKGRVGEFNCGIAGVDGAIRRLVAALENRNVPSARHFCPC
jgi:hypothetical protein